ncbi:hypothetical protein N477_04095 [Pseudoalteromonas luteoviolacea H33-S]|nr:hypothetical protein N477_04095 [Pseudoalteromonas luteoviolacea H33-S]
MTQINSINQLIVSFSSYRRKNDSAIKFSKSPFIPQKNPLKIKS